MARARSVRSLLAQLEDLPPGFARTATAEEAVRVADAAQDLDAGYEARVALASAAEHGGEAQKALVAVTWCLGRIDEHPGRFDIHAPYWALKWLPHTLLDIPTVPLEEITRVVEEMRRRYEAEGTGQDAVAKLAWTIPLRLGRVAEAVAGHRAWRLVARTEFGDCHACDVSSEVELAIAGDDPELAVGIARPLLTGRLECAEEPARVLGTLLAPLTGLGRHEEAERLHTWGLRLARGNPSLVATQAEHVLHLVRTGRPEAALELLGDLVAVCDRGLFDVEARLLVSAAGAGVAGTLAEAGTDRLVHPLGERPVDTAALARWFAADARSTADAFDRRNGTDVQSRRVDRWMATRPVAAAPVLATIPADVVHEPVQAPISTPRTTDDPADLLLRLWRTPGLTDDECLVLAERAEAGFAGAGDDLGAARARRQGGAALLRLGRDDEAVRTLEAVFPRLADDPGEQARAALDLAHAWFDRDRLTGEHHEWLARAREAAGRTPEPDTLLGRCLLAETGWGVAQLGPEPDAAALAAVLAGFAEARDLLGEPDELAYAWAAEAECRAAVDDLDGAVRDAATGWDLLGADDVDGSLAVGALYAGLLSAREEWDPALQVLAVARDRASAAGARAAAARTSMARTDLLTELGRHEEALPSAWDAIDLFRVAGDPAGLAGARLELARLLRELGRDADAHELLAELVGQASDDGDREFEGTVALDLALLELDYDVLDDGLDHARQALSCFESDPGPRARVFRALANLHAAGADWADALAAGEEAIAAFEPEGNPVLSADVRREQAGRLVLAGRAEAALDLFAQVRAAYLDEALPLAVATADLGRVDALAALGRLEEAVRLAEEVAAVGVQEEVPALEADALWAAALHRGDDAAAFDRALEAYRRAGAAPEELDELLARRDAELGKRRRGFRRRR